MKINEFIARTRKKLLLLSRTVGYVYSFDTKSTLLRDLLIIVITALEMYTISLGGKLIDSVADLLQNYDQLTLESFFYTRTFQVLMVMLAVWITIRGFEGVRAYYAQKIRGQLENYANAQILEKISTENLQDLETKKLQSLMTFVPGFSIDKIYLVYDSFGEIVRNFLRMISALVLLFPSFGVLAFYLIIVAVPEPFINYIYERKLKKYRESEVEGIKFVNYMMKIGTSLQNFAELRVNGTLRYIRNRFYKGNYNYERKFTGKFMHYQIDSSFGAVVDQILLYIFIIYTLFYTVKNKLSIGDFSVYYNYSRACYQAGFDMVNKSFMMAEYLGYTEKFFELLDYQGFGDLPSDTKVLLNDVPVMKFESLDFKYPGRSNKVLENLSFEIQPGQKVAFVGGDSSGKSTLVKMFAGLYRITAGDFTLDGLSVRELERNEHKSKISVLFQDFVRYDLSIKKNITISHSKLKTNESLYDRAKKAVGFDKFMKKHGYKDEQLLGKYFRGGVDISLGHWQRLAIARMLYRNAEIFIMDEPFTYIDGSSRRSILKNVFDFIGENRTLIYITQDTDQLRIFDYIYYLKDGKIVESGNYKKLIEKKGHFYKDHKLNQ